MSNQRKIANYKISDSINHLYASITGHLILLLIFIFVAKRIEWMDPRIQVLALTLLGLIVYKWLGDLRNNNTNLVIMLAYIALLAYEFITAGLPSIGVNYEGINKGIMMDILIAITPYVYLGIRVGLVFPLIQIIWNVRKGQTDNQS